MPDIYTDKWYEALLELAGTRDDLSAKVPQGQWLVAMELEGDGISPYISPGETKHLFARIMNGKLVEFRESPERVTGRQLQFRFMGPAHVFEEVAAGLLDPVEAGLSGSIVIRGDMRLFLQHAELMKVIFDVYARNNVTDWPKGKPPFK
ncbi:MAG: hypothetical protein HY787_26680 [Deltaproteobacteria bacterium]|nr:hypothetical protein [Deltaproteobacteria bacterium]